ncbi:MAG: signal peptidase II [Brevinematales bacterium]|nr:signal peptidase II [Brevinematales bacterium]
MKEFITKFRYSLRSILEFAIANKITISIVLAVVVIDQITKYISRTFLEYGKPLNVIGDFLKFTLVFNKGVSFGILNSSEATIIHSILPFIVVGIIIFLVYIYISISKDVDVSLIPFLKVGFGLVWGGAIGNLIDRIFFSYVTDFIDVGIGNIWRFYIFNIADSCITIGTLIIIFMMIVSDVLKSRKQKSDSYEN